MADVTVTTYKGKVVFTAPDNDEPFTKEITLKRTVYPNKDSRLVFEYDVKWSRKVSYGYLTEITCKEGNWTGEFTRRSPGHPTVKGALKKILLHNPKGEISVNFLWVEGSEEWKTEATGVEIDEITFPEEEL